MTSYSELKRLAEAATKSKWTTDGDWDVMSAESDQLNNGYVIAQFQGPDRKANADFCAAANPSIVLALISENERLSGECEGCPMAIAEALRIERDQIKTENERLRLALKSAEDAMWKAESNMDNEAADIRDLLAAMDQGERSDG